MNEIEQLQQHIQDFKDQAVAAENRGDKSRALGIREGIARDEARLEVLTAAQHIGPSQEELAEAKAQELIKAKKFDDLVAAKVAEIDTPQPEKPDS